MTSSFTIFTFGYIRPYKGLEVLIDAFRRWPEPTARLQIRGKAMFQQLSEELVRRASGDPRICVSLGEVPKDALKRQIEGSQLIVLPYKKILNSGAAALALSLERPLLAPAKGCIVDYAERLGPDWIMTFDEEVSELDLERAFQRFRRPPPAVGPDLEWMHPDRVAAELISVYQELSRLNS
jgi:beta-1,4-mannosyltransferase